MEDKKKNNNANKSKKTEEKRKKRRITRILKEIPKEEKIKNNVILEEYLCKIFSKEKLMIKEKKLTSKDIEEHLYGNETNINNFLAKLYVEDGQILRLINLKKVELIKKSVKRIISDESEVKLVLEESENKFIERFKNDKYNFSYTKLINAILENPNFKNLKIIKEQKQINNLIPDNPVDLYPKTRGLKRHFILHIGDTNSGKTYDALQRFMEAESGIYLGPLRLLAMEVQDKALANNVLCSLLTGEEEDNIKNAKHIACTVEMLSSSAEYSVAVIDEAQMIADPVRGGAWTRALMSIYAKEIHVCMSNDARDIVRKIIEECGDTYEIVEHKRNTPLIMEDKKFVFPESVQRYDALIVFSRKKVLAVASYLEKKGYKVSKIYGTLPYVARKNEVNKFINGETDIVVSTDAIGMGMNLPLKRIVFLETDKYDGTNFRALNMSEIKQIAGRAGRFGMFNEGYVNSLLDKNFITENLKKPYKFIEKARLSIPEEILVLDIPIDKTMIMWKKIEEDNNYIKSDLDDLYQKNMLVKKCLKWNPDVTLSKKEIWSFISIPMDINQDSIKNIYVSLINAYCQSGNVEDFIINYLNTLRKFSNDLYAYENIYKQLDLFYSFARVTNASEKVKDRIIEGKKELSDEIIKLLNTITKSNPIKICKDCGGIIFDGKYDLCRSCYNEYKYQYSWYGWY